MTRTQIDLIKGTIPILRENGVLLTTYFYQRMFSHNPELKAVFNMGNQQSGRQQQALAHAVLAYAEHIENPTVLLQAIDHIGQKHTSLQIQPEQYLVVGQHLLHSISEVLEVPIEDELIAAWKAAYFQLAEIMIEHEKKLYAHKNIKEGAWEGWRTFIIKDKVKESTEITSFYLYPKDKLPISSYEAGQFISVRSYIEQVQYTQPRQYSLSTSANAQYYRISVKKEDIAGKPPGMLSNVLHDKLQIGDELELSMPSGNFIYQSLAETVVFLSAGVGQTPLLAMLETALADSKNKKIYYIHASRNKEVHAFKNRIEGLTAAFSNLYAAQFYSDLETHQADAYAGYMNLDLLPPAIIHPDHQYYICGPVSFMLAQRAYLLDKGIGSSQIFWEEFGPATL